MVGGKSAINKLYHVGSFMVWLSVRCWSDYWCGAFPVWTSFIMSYTRVICIALLWSCINKEAILCFTIITYIGTASCDQLIHLNANVKVNPYYGMHWASTTSVHLISLMQKRHFSLLLTASTVKTWIHYRTISLGVLRGSEHASSKA